MLTKQEKKMQCHKGRRETFHNSIAGNFAQQKRCHGKKYMVIWYSIYYEERANT